jgi:GNAT superfamily N-acetyltransferase
MNQDQQDIALRFIQSLNYLFNMTYHSHHHAIDGVHIADYRESGYQPDDFQIEYFTIDTPPIKLQAVIQQVAPDAASIINVFHPPGQQDDAQAIIDRLSRKHTYRYTAPLQKVRLPAPFETRIEVDEVFDVEDVEQANQTLGDSDRPMLTEGIGDPLLRRFSAIIEDKAVGWAQMVNAVVPGTAYIGEMFTLPDYRNQGVAAALLNRIHEEARATDCDTVLLVPSLMAKDFYGQYGYQTVVEYSVFHREGE